jgi:hypothetical protein
MGSFNITANRTTILIFSGHVRLLSAFCLLRRISPDLAFASYFGVSSFQLPTAPSTYEKGKPHPAELDYFQYPLEGELCSVPVYAHVFWVLGG